MKTLQSALFYLCCAAFLTGLLLALFYDFLYMTRLWLIPSDKRYTVETIQRLRAARIKAENEKARKGIGAVLFLEDVFFCLVASLAVILLLYWLNDGAFRAAAPLCMALGFGAFRVTLSRGTRVAFQWLAFGIEAALYTLWMPFKRLFVGIAEVCRRAAQKRHQKRLFRQRKTYTKQMLQDIERTATGLLPNHIDLRVQKGK